VVLRRLGETEFAIMALDRFSATFAATAGIASQIQKPYEKFKPKFKVYIEGV
jgi:hypothetical protein